MLKRHKNDLFVEVQAAELNPADFRLSEEVSGAKPALVIAFRNTNLKFVARHKIDDYEQFDYFMTKFAPSFPRNPRDGYLPPASHTSFEKLLPAFRSWLDTEVKRYIEDEMVPDLWAQVSQAGSPGQDGPDTSPFTDEERHQVKNALKTFELLVVQNFAPDANQLVVVERHLDYLAEAVDRRCPYRS